MQVIPLLNLFSSKWLTTFKCISALFILSYVCHEAKIQLSSITSVVSALLCIQFLVLLMHLGIHVCTSFTSFVADSSVSCPPSLGHFITSLEIVERIYGYRTWSVLVDLMHILSGVRLIGFRFLRSRICVFMLMFFDSSQLNTFFDLLDDTSAILVGGVVQLIMSLSLFDHMQDINPDHLSLVIPFHSSSNGLLQSFERWWCFVSSCGYCK